MNKRYRTEIYGYQRGVALITGLIFLVVLTLISITAARMAGLEERMSGNTRDRSLAVQAAEMALRDAELDIRNSGRVSGITNFVSACTNGLCYNGIQGGGTGDPNNWNTRPVWDQVSMTAAPSVAYGAFTGAANPGTAGADLLAQLSAPPRYIIEGIKKIPPGGAEEFYYRVTVRAQGANPNTVVWLQEVFKP